MHPPSPITPIPPISPPAPPAPGPRIDALALYARVLAGVHFSDAAERSPSSLLLGRGKVADGPGESAPNPQGPR